MAIATIPVILTKADWDKQKGVIAKIGVGETGIGAQMDKVKAVYGAVDWTKFNAANRHPTSDPGVVDEELKEAKSEYASKVEKVRAELRVLVGLAQKAQAVFKSKPLIPKASAEHVGKIAAAADHMAVALKSMDAEFAAFENRKKIAEQNRQAIYKVFLGYVTKMEPAIAKLNSKPNVVEYETFHKELVRGLAAALSRQKELAAFMNAWKTFSGDGYKPKNDSEIKPKLAAINQELIKLKAALK
jgi:hypothetical protein